MSLRSWFASHKSVFVHAISVGSMLFGSLLKRQGNPGLVAGITAVTSAYHIGEGLKAGGTEGIKEVTDSIKDLTGQARGYLDGLLSDTKDTAADAADAL